MRILHLIHSEGIYGAESILLYLARAQQQLGHEPVVGSIRDPGTPQTEFEAWIASRGVEVVPIRVAPRPTPGVVSSLLAATRSVTADVIHSHGYKANILLGFLPRQRRGPMLATLHGWTATRAASRMWLYEHVDRLALRRLDAVVVVARHMLDLPSIRKIPAKRRLVIENGIPPLETRLAELSARGAPAIPDALAAFVAQSPTIVAIGRLSAEKGFAQLLEAFARARANAAASHQLLIIGDGPLREVLAQRITSLRLGKLVKLGGYVAGADRLLQHASGFVMSSLTEGLPLALLEAMQWRVPILATAVGAVPEILAHGQRGALVAANDVAALALGLESLMRPGNSVSSQSVAAAYGAVAKDYSSEQMALQYAAAYQSIL
jgi:glycosyltransferase involved in cell wall biosynthesis